MAKTQRKQQPKTPSFDSLLIFAGLCVIGAFLYSSMRDGSWNAPAPVPAFRSVAKTAVKGATSPSQAGSALSIDEKTQFRAQLRNDILHSTQMVVDAAVDSSGAHSRAPDPSSKGSAFHCPLPVKISNRPPPRLYEAFCRPFSRCLISLISERVVLRIGAWTFPQIRHRSHSKLRSLSSNLCDPPSTQNSSGLRLLRSICHTCRWGDMYQSG